MEAAKKQTKEAKETGRGRGSKYRARTVIRRKGRALLSLICMLVRAN